jgi:hypothetical protein
MAGVADVRRLARALVGPVAGHKPRAWRERKVLPLVHAFLLGGYASVTDEPPAPLPTQQQTRAEFRFGDRPHGANPCMLEVAVRGTETVKTALSQYSNRSELRKLARYPPTKASGGRVLLLLDFDIDPMDQSQLVADYSSYNLGPGSFKRYSVSVVYVHHAVDFRFTWCPFAK